MSNLAQHTPPFPRGTTFFGGESPSLTNQKSLDIEGVEAVFADVDPDTGVSRTPYPVTVRAMRNVSTVSVSAKDLVRAQISGLHIGKRFDGKAYVRGEKCYPVDEHLSGSCAVNDICWVVTKGPAMVTTAVANGQGNSIAVGDLIQCVTAAASTGTTAGRAGAMFELGAATSGVTDMLTQFKEYRNVIGKALSARTTNETASDVLILVGQDF